MSVFLKLQVFSSNLIFRNSSVEIKNMNLDFIYNPVVNLVGSKLLPAVNGFANVLTGFKRKSTDPNFQKSRNVYPGAHKCNSKHPHSLWHESSANGLVDIIFLSNEVREIMGGKTLVKDGDKVRVGPFKQKERLVEKGDSAFYANLRERLAPIG